MDIIQIALMCLTIMESLIAEEFHSLLIPEGCKFNHNHLDCRNATETSLNIYNTFNVSRYTNIYNIILHYIKNINLI